MYDQLVKPKPITVTEVPCEDGKSTFPSVTFMVEEYGSPTFGDGAAKPVVVILPFFLGSARAAGHSGRDETTSKPKNVGYWDGLIGPDAALNTDSHRIISFGPLINGLCGPSAKDPATQKPFGSRFPNFSFRDYAAIQRKALDQLGVSQIDILAGASMGSLQAWHLAAQDMTRINRMLLVVPGGLMLPNKTRTLAAQWVQELESDPAWKQGDYYDSPADQRPVAIQKVLAEFWYRCQFPLDESMVYEPDEVEWANVVGNLKALVPTISMNAKVIDDVLDKAKASNDPALVRFRSQVATLIKITDHNDLLWQLRTIGTFGADAALRESDDLRFGWMGDQDIAQTRPNGQVMPKVLIIYAPDDDIFNKRELEDTQKAPFGLGSNVSLVALKAKSPHASGLQSKPLEGLSDVIRVWQRPAKL